jgi:hypothetical protein
MLGAPGAHALVVKIRRLVWYWRAYVVNETDERVSPGPAGLASVGGKLNLMASRCKNGTKFKYRG